MLTLQWFRLGKGRLQLKLILAVTFIPTSHSYLGSLLYIFIRIGKGVAEAQSSPNQQHERELPDSIACVNKPSSAVPLISFQDIFQRQHSPAKHLYRKHQNRWPHSSNSIKASQTQSHCTIPILPIPINLSQLTPTSFLNPPVSSMKSERLLRSP